MFKPNPTPKFLVVYPVQLTNSESVIEASEQTCIFVVRGQ